MQPITVLSDIEYTLGWSFTNKLHIILDEALCCPLAMYLLQNSLIESGSSWNETIRVASQIFEKDELEGFLDGVRLSKMMTKNYPLIQKYATGYLVGKNLLKRFTDA